MNKSQDATLLELAAIVLAGCGFGSWRGSFGAGVFMALLIMLILCESNDWRNALKGGSK